MKHLAIISLMALLCISLSAVTIETMSGNIINGVLIKQIGTQYQIRLKDNNKVMIDVENIKKVTSEEGTDITDAFLNPSLYTPPDTQKPVETQIPLKQQINPPMEMTERVVYQPIGMSYEQQLEIARTVARPLYLIGGTMAISLGLGLIAGLLGAF